MVRIARRRHRAYLGIVVRLGSFRPWASVALFFHGTVYSSFALSSSGREVTAIVTKEGNKLISVQTAKKAGEKSTKTVREFLDQEVIQTMEVLGTDVVCVQKFKRLE